MATQVKFYSTAEYSSTQNAGGIYFVGGPKNGELYRGTTRFGAGRVTEVANLASAPTDAIRGDIAVCAQGGAFAYDGTKWVAIGPDLAAVRESWLADISTSINALDVSFVGASDTTKIITGIEQKDGKIIAHAEAFPELTSPSDGHLSLNGTNVEISGWTSLTSLADDLKSRVEALESWESDISGDDIVVGTKVTAETGKFTNLTVEDTATFNATTVSATNLSVDDEDNALFGGLTISAIADRQIAAIAEATSTASDDGVTVTAKTEAGSIKSVAVAVAGASTVADFASTASQTKVTTVGGVKAYVDETLKDINGAMRFYGTTKGNTVSEGAVVIGTITKATGVTDALQPGDVVVSEDDGKEYIYDGSAWRELGDDTLDGEIATYVGLANKLTLGKNGEDAIASIAGATDLTGAVNNVGKAVDVLNGADTVDGSVAKSIKTAVEALDAEQDSNKEEDNDNYVDNRSIKVTLTEVDGKITGLGADLLWLGADGNVLGETPVASEKGGHWFGLVNEWTDEYRQSGTNQWVSDGSRNYITFVPGEGWYYANTLVSTEGINATHLSGNADTANGEVTIDLSWSAD